MTDWSKILWLTAHGALSFNSGCGEPVLAGRNNYSSTSQPTFSAGPLVIGLWRQDIWPSERHLDPRSDHGETVVPRGCKIRGVIWLNSKDGNIKYFRISITSCKAGGRSKLQSPIPRGLSVCDD